MDIIGEPPPTVVWTVDGNPLKSGKAVNIDNVDYNSKLVIRPVSRDDSGTYTITATNSSGKDSVTVNIIVTDKPGKPEVSFNFHRTYSVLVPRIMEMYCIESLLLILSIIITTSRDH